MELVSDTIDTIKEGGSSNLMEATEPMEVHSAVTTALPIKRKAESDVADDEIEEIREEIEEINDENEEESGGCIDAKSHIESVNEYFKSTWITPIWGEDSFDGLEFDPSQEKTEYLDDYDDVDVEQWLKFRQQHIENKGFYVDQELWPMYKYSEYTVIDDLEASAGKGQTYGMYFKEMACLCLERFNKEKKEIDENFINVEFVEVVGGVVKHAKKAKAFITFKAKEKPDGPLVDYQAKIWSDIVEDKNRPNKYVVEDYPILCRPAPPPKLSN